MAVPHLSYGTTPTASSHATPETVAPLTGLVPRHARPRSVPARDGYRHDLDGLRAVAILLVVVYHVWLGRQGIGAMGELLLQRTAYARDALTALEGVSALHEQPDVREFAVKVDAPVDRVIERCAAQGINPGYALGNECPEFENGLLVALTEQRTRAHIDRLAKVLGEAVAAERSGAPIGATA